MTLYLIKTYGLGSYYVLAKNILVAQNLLESELSKANHGSFEYREIVEIKIITKEIPIDYKNKDVFNFSTSNCSLLIQGNAGH